MWKKMNLSTKLLLSIAILSMISLITLFIIINTTIRGMIVSYVHENFEQNNTLMSRDVDDWINHFKSQLESKEIMAAKLPRDMLDDMAFGFWEQNDDIAVSFFTHSERGTVASSVYGELPADWELFSRPWYIAARENPGQVAVRNPFWSLVEQAWATSVSKTTTFADGAEDVVSFTIILDAVFNKMSEFEIAGGGYIFLVGSDAIIITHPSLYYTPDQDLKPLWEMEVYSEVLSDILRYESSIPFTTVDGVAAYIFTQPLASSDWLMVSVVYASSINEVVNRLTTIVLGTVSAILIALSVVLLVYIFRLLKTAIARSVTEFRESSASLAMGETLEISRDMDNSFGLSEMFKDALNQIVEHMQQVQISESKREAKSKFLANMSHEIRTPMNAILGITEIQLHRDSLDDDSREAFEKVYVSGDMLLGIVNDILDLSKIEDGKMELIIEKYEVASVINDTIVLNMMRIEDKNITFEISIEETMPAYFLGDELRIKQVLNNILSNAFKYTDEGVVKMSVSTQEAQGDSVVLVIAISDTGQGMSEEQVKSLFDAYSQFNQSVNRFIEGTGLGMNITSNLINMMEGKIEVESELGRGSVITVYLPQVKVGDQQLGAETAKNLSSHRAGSSAKMKRVQITREPMPYGKVLVVDDIEMNIYVAMGLMAPYKLNIDSTNSGLAAIDRVKAGKEYDIIFMDHMMPDLDGMETTKQIRELGYEKPIVALTANAVAGQAEIFLSNGFDDFISKPIDIRQLNLVLNKLVRDKHLKEAGDQAPQTATEENPQLHLEEGSKSGPDANIIELFLKDGKRSLAILYEIMAKGIPFSANDLRMFVIQTHGMKSSLALMKKMDLSAIALKLEEAGQEENYDVIEAETPAFLKGLRAVLHELTRLKDSEDNDDTEAVESEEDKLLLHESLLAIKEACVEFDDTILEDTLSELEEKTWSKPTRELFALINEKLLRGDFDEIIEAIDKFME